MQYLFMPSSNTATNGKAIQSINAANVADKDIEIFKIVIGTLVNSGNIWIYDVSNAVNAATTNIAFKTTLPATIPTTGAAVVTVIDLTDGKGNGLVLGEGGTAIIDQTMNVTILWDYRGRSQ